MNRKFYLNLLLFGKVIFVLWCCAFFNITLAGNGPSKSKTEDKPPFCRPVTSFSGSGGAGSGRASVFASPEPSHVSEKRVKFGSISYDWSEVPEGEVRAPEPAPMMRGPMVSQALAHASPLTVWNDWPDSVSNRSIFYYLRGKGNSDSFSEFVRSCYRSSCAIVYYDEEGPVGIIGSGSYLSDHKVATARHCVEHFSLESLYARFFDYDVDGYEIKGTYIDVPITRVENAEGGLDAAYLYLFPLDTSLFSRYARSLSIETDLGPGGDFATLPPGSYAMFHFARGVHHQVSIGHVPLSTIGAPLHNNIPISAWNGASGATIIQRNGLSGAIRGYGISIYRNSSDERRVIPFAKFENPGWQDNISAPYSPLNSFPVLRSGIFDLEGYEYLQWMVDYAKQGKGGSAHPHPYNNIYAVADPNHINHHIIPRTDLWFLWMYVFDSDKDSDANLGRPNYKKLMDQVRLQKVADPSLDDDKLFADHKARYEFIQKCLKDLCPDWKTPTGALDGSSRSARGFAWSEWNLFKGWKNRRDDPGILGKQDGTFNFSERQKPSGFSDPLWTILKGSLGLYNRIRELKMESRSGLPDVGFLDKIIVPLDELHKFWGSQAHAIYDFNLGDWVLHPDGTYSLR